MILFNKAYKSKNEEGYVKDVLSLDKQSGDGKYTKLCSTYLKTYTSGSTSFLTTSCTHSLELAALILKIQKGDEVIIPSLTFVSTANAFLLRGAKIVFCDSQKNNPNMDIKHVSSLITDKTKVIIPVHYAGIACNMDELLYICQKQNIKIIEDNAHGIGAFYKGKPLGTLGDLGCVSFHDTKNISCGEGGVLFVNDPSLNQSAEVIREKGTDRAAYFRGEINKYGWKSLGSSYLLSDILAAKLLAQLEELDYITERRKKTWKYYFDSLSILERQGKCRMPYVHDYADHNGHIFYLVCRNGKERDKLICYLKNNGIQSAFHYQSLHKSRFFKNKYQGCELPNTDRFTNCLIRLPIYPSLSFNNQRNVIHKILLFYNASF